MTEATQQALCGLRDLTMIKWYVIPLLAIVFYIYTREIKEARKKRRLERDSCRPDHFRRGFFQRNMERLGDVPDAAFGFLDNSRRYGSADPGGLEY